MHLWQSPIWGSCNHHQGCSISFRLVIIYYNPLHEYICKPLTKIIRAIQNILFDTSPGNTIITPEKLWQPFIRCLIISLLSFH